MTSTATRTGVYCYVCDALVAADRNDDHLYLCRSCWLKVVRPGRELTDVLTAVYKYKNEPSALDCEDYHDLRLLGLWPKFHADTDIICEELGRRSEFDKEYRSAWQRHLDQLDPEERHRLATVGAGEIGRRLEFDDKHPGIYRTGQERCKAYDVFFPPPLTQEDVEAAFANGGMGPVLLPLTRPGG